MTSDEAPSHSAAPSEGRADLHTHLGLDDLDAWGGAAPEGAPVRDPLWVRGLRGIVEVLDVAILALAMLLIVQFTAHNYIVDGPSMQPTFHDGEFVLVNRLAYRSYDLTWLPGVDAPWDPFGDPQPGDVVVFWQFSGDEGRQLIKRVIAVAGQTVEVRDGLAWVDGVALDEPYISAPAEYTYPPTTLADGELFVLGDNRLNSADSHLFGPIAVDAVVGRAELRYWPFDVLGRIVHGLGTPVEGAATAR